MKMLQRVAMRTKGECGWQICFPEVWSPGEPGEAHAWIEGHIGTEDPFSKPAVRSTGMFEGSDKILLWWANSWEELG